MKVVTLCEQKENKKIYRLFYINIVKTIFQEKPKYKDGDIYMPFMIPDGMLQEDFFKVLSFLLDQVENYYVYSDEREIVEMLDKALSNDKYHFNRLSEEEVNYQDINEIAIIKGKGQHYISPTRKYCNWYTSGVSIDDVEAIYDKLGLKLDDLTKFDELNYKQSINH